MRLAARLLKRLTAQPAHISGRRSSAVAGVRKIKKLEIN